MAAAAAAVVADAVTTPEDASIAARAKSRTRRSHVDSMMPSSMFMFPHTPDRRISTTLIKSAWQRR